MDNSNNNSENAKQLQTEKSSSFKRQPMSNKTINNNNDNDTLRQRSPSIQSNHSAAGSARSYRSAIKPYVDKDLQSLEEQQQQQRQRSSSPKKQVVEEKSLNNNNTQRESSISVPSARSVANSSRSNQSGSAHPSSTEKHTVAKSSIDAIHENPSGEQQQYTTNDKTIMNKTAVHENLLPAHSSEGSLDAKTPAPVAAPKEQYLSVDLVNAKDSEKASSQMEENTNDNMGANEKDSVNDKMQEDRPSSLPTPSNQKLEKSINNDIITENGKVSELSSAQQQTDHIRDDLTDFEIEYDYGDDGGVFVGQEEEQQQQRQRQEDHAVSSAPASESQKQRQRVNKEMEFSHTDYNDDDQNNMDIAHEEQLELVPLSRLPISRQEQRRAGTVIASEFNTSKLVYNMSVNPTQEEIETVQQGIINSFTRTTKNSKVKPMVELLKELGTIAMNCTNEVQ